MLFIRPAAATEAKEIAQVHVTSWNETYQGLLPDHVMKDNHLENRFQYWTYFLRHVPEKTKLFVAELVIDSKSQIVGFGLAGPEKIGLTEFDGEIQALYISDHGRGRGIGRKLMKAMGKYLIQQDLRKVCVWAVFENYNAREFYQHMGGHPVACRYLQLGPDKIRETAYGWENPEQVGA